MVALVSSLIFSSQSPPPHHQEKRESLLDRLLELAVVGGLRRIRFAECQRAVEKRLLNLFEHLRDGFRNSLLRDERLPFLAGAVAPRQHHRSLGHVLRPQFQAQRHAAHLPIVELEAGAHAFALVHLHANARIDEFAAQLAAHFRGRSPFLRPS